MNVSRAELAQCIEPHFHEDLVNAEYSVEDIDAKNLLTYNRIDLGFKLLYLEMLGRSERYATEVYQQHIRAFSLGRYAEPGSRTKTSKQRFLEEFKDTYRSIKEDGFNKDLSIIPLSRNGSIANGSHRVACAAYLDIKVPCAEIETADHIYDYRFFFDRNVSTRALDAAVTKFIEYAPHVYIAFVWPVADGKDAEIGNVIPNIIYRNDVKLNQNGAHNLISQIYYGEKWLGTIEDNFGGARNKLVECFKVFSAIRVIAFQSESADEVLKIKEDIRTLFGIGKHSIHITDDKEEAVRVARVVFNDNSIHFLNHAQPNKYLSAHAQVNRFKKFLAHNNAGFNDIILDASIVMAVYGLREANDVDYLAGDNLPIEYTVDGINDHSEEMVYYEKTKNDLIYDPENYFCFNDLKFVSLPNLYKMKSKRAEAKDFNDLSMIATVLEKRQTESLPVKLYQIMNYQRLRLRKRVIEALKAIGLYEIARTYYRKFKNGDIRGG